MKNKKVQTLEFCIFFLHTFSWV